MSTDEKILSRIAAALSLAENAGTEAEAEHAMATAQRIASTYSIDLAKARSHQAGARRRATPTHRTVTLGEAGKRGLHTYVGLFLVIAKANDLTCNIAHNSTYVIAFGFDEDVTIAEALYASLVVQMVRGSDQYLKAGTYKDELVFRQVTRTEPDGWTYREWAEAPVTAASARINFQQAFAERIGARLVEAKQSAEAASIAEDAALMARTSIAADPGHEQGRTGTELAILEKSVEVTDYYSRHSTARGSWRGGRATTVTSYDARRAGDRAGRAARLGTEKAIGGSRRSIAS